MVWLKQVWVTVSSFRLIKVSFILNIKSFYFKAFTTALCAKKCEKRGYESIGRPFPFTETKIVDPKTNQIVDIGSDGELWVRGFNVIPEYWGEPKKTIETIDEKKWLHTGDICTMDKDGYLYFKSRSKDLIIRGGVNVYPGKCFHVC